MPLKRRTATLLAFVRMLEATAQDDVLDLFDIVVTALFTDAAKVGKKARLRTIRDLDAAVSLSLWCLAGLLLARLLRTERQWRVVNAVLGSLLAASIIPMWLE